MGVVATIKIDETVAENNDTYLYYQTKQFEGSGTYLISYEVHLVQNDKSRLFTDPLHINAYVYTEGKFEHITILTNKGRVLYIAPEENTKCAILHGIQCPSCMEYDGIFNGGLGYIKCGFCKSMFTLSQYSISDASSMSVKEFFASADASDTKNK